MTDYYLSKVFDATNDPSRESPACAVAIDQQLDEQLIVVML